MDKSDLRNSIERICKVCGEPAGKPILEVPSSNQKAGTDTFRVFHCHRCGLIFVAPDPSESDLAKVYCADNYDKDMRTSPKWRAWIKHRHWYPLLSEIEKTVSPGRLLDVGCSDGYFMDLAAERGWQVFGFDVNKDIVELAKKTHGDNVRCETVYEMNWPDSHFDTVRLCHVLEHLVDPIKALSNIHRVLRNGGLLSLALPVLDKRVFSLLELLPVSKLKKKLFRVVGCLFPPEHLSVWSTESLTHALESSGFETIWRSYRSDIMPWIKGCRRYWFFHRALGIPLKIMGTGFNIEVLALKP